MPPSHYLSTSSSNECAKTATEAIESQLAVPAALRRIENILGFLEGNWDNLVDQLAPVLEVPSEGYDNSVSQPCNNVPLSNHLHVLADRIETLNCRVLGTKNSLHV